MAEMCTRIRILIIMVFLAVLLQGCYTSKVRAFDNLSEYDHITRITTTDSIDIFITSKKKANAIILPDAICLYSDTDLSENSFLLEVPAEYIDYTVIDNSYIRGNSYSATEFALDILLTIFLSWL